MSSKVTGPVFEHKHFISILGAAYKLKLKLKTCPQLQMTEFWESILEISEYSSCSVITLLIRPLLQPLLKKGLWVKENFGLP